ncbi:MAG: hypothetical protein JWN01_494 [Patescibacteria group bacterium]|nr:hypothetical protein [Patescibacteria group bacterium]
MPLMLNKKWIVEVEPRSKPQKTSLLTFAWVLQVPNSRDFKDYQRKDGQIAVFFNGSQKMEDPAYGSGAFR